MSTQPSESVTQAKTTERTTRWNQIQQRLRQPPPELPGKPVTSRRAVASTLSQLLLLLVLLLLIGAAFGLTDLITIPWWSKTPDTLDSVIQSTTGDVSTQNATGFDPFLRPGPCVLDNNLPPVSPRFQDFYNAHGGQSIFGRPVTGELLASSGQMIQWFERAQLQTWPQYDAIGYGIQSGRLGTQYTAGVTFQEVVPQPAGPDVAYFPETGYSVGAPFLQFWQANGLDIIGYPISNVVLERLSDGQVYYVQYFERVRLELHPAGSAPPAGQVQVGLLGRAFCLNESKPDLVNPTATVPSTATPQP